MASTDKTPKLGLNQWAAGDKVLRADFNADNGKIDAGVQGAMEAAAAAHALAAGKARMVAGEYKGDGVNHRKIVLGFRPGLLIIQGHYSSGHAIILATKWRLTFIFGNGTANIIKLDAATHDGGYLKLVEDGFTLGLTGGQNLVGKDYSYVAFG